MSHWTEKLFVKQSGVFKKSMRRRVETADEEVENLLALVGDHGIEPEMVLDVACGIGRHAVELAEAGITVHGIDISRDYVETARERAAQVDVADQATFEVADMRDLAAVGGEYDLVLNMWTSFGYFEEATNEAVAEAFRKRVADDGVLVMELPNKEAQMANYQDSGVSRDGDIFHAEWREYTPETGRLETNAVVLRDRDDGYEFVGEMSWEVRTYAPAELRRLLERAGFSSVHLYGGLDRTALKRESSRLVVVAEP